MEFEFSIDSEGVEMLKFDGNKIDATWDEYGVIDHTLGNNPDNVVMTIDLRDAMEIQSAIGGKIIKWQMYRTEYEDVSLEELAAV